MEHEHEVNAAFYHKIVVIEHRAIFQSSICVENKFILLDVKIE